jgi:hypothetical protein
MNNIIEKTKMAAIGCMSDGNTKEDYQAADIPERIYLINNTMVNNHYGVVGGDNIIVLNNIIMDTKKIALKKNDGKSIVMNNCIWQNGTDNVGSNINKKNMINKDPMLKKNFQLKTNSPCIGKSDIKLIKSDKYICNVIKNSMPEGELNIGAWKFAENLW